MENTHEKRTKNVNCYFCIVITQVVCVMLILISLVCIKYFFKNTYKKINVFYNEEICSTTDINEVIKNED